MSLSFGRIPAAAAAGTAPAARLIQPGLFTGDRGQVSQGRTQRGALPPVKIPGCPASARPARKVFNLAAIAIALLGLPTTTIASTRFVSPTGQDVGGCTSAAAPCRTISYGISQMSGGDTLIVGNGTYTEPNAIRHVPSGNSGPDGIPRTPDDVYTRVRAESDFGVLIDGSQWPDTYIFGLRLSGKHFIEVRGFRFYTSQAHQNSGPMSLDSSTHIKIIRNGFGYAGVTGNVAAAGAGPDTDYVLFEENFAFGGARYMFLNYWATHSVFRRNVARNDYWNGTLQAAAFTNYDSTDTVWQNNIAIDSNVGCCTGHSGLYAAFFNENKTDHAPDTSQEFHGNIVLNYKSIYGAHLDWVTSGTRHLTDNLWWDSNGGYCGEQGDGLAASWPVVTHLTSGAHTGIYDPPNGGCMRGTGFAINQNLANQVVDSIFVNNQSFGVAGFVHGNHNAYFGNGAPYGGAQPSPGAGDVTTHNIVYSPTNPGGSLRFLPRGPEDASPLATAGTAGGRIGARLLWKIGVDGTLYGEPGWNVERSPQNGYGRPEDRLWPFPNEAVIKAEFAAYSGGGLPGARGFAAPGLGLYGGPRTLSSYIWEYLGSPCPSSACSVEAIFADGFED
ncbi:hypothetical protein [Tahibacter amnicola]|uniref:Parallel beta helix pectate lyase-like protein n=1 Tax=Tahibacter amnicola TaxID=2976241 RepID=A0ABY6B7S0_9GAMM|nr:hypothetical protein [Tahibacter amnicola]UXI66143.1 hypothetical protein N4264_15450 [Tahibacter amnicola]